VLPPLTLKMEATYCSENVTNFLPHYEQTVLFMVTAVQNSYFIFVHFTFAMKVLFAVKHEKSCTVLKMERFNCSVGMQIHFM